LIHSLLTRQNPTIDMSSSTRGRGGKFSKPKRGGGKHFSRDLQPLNKDGEVINMWADPSPEDEEDDDDDEEDSDEEESDEDDDGRPGPVAPREEVTREQRKAQAKARKEAAIAKRKGHAAEPGDLPPSESDEDEDDDDDMPANPNHTAKARSQAAAAVTAAAVTAAAPATNGKTPTSQLSRREREALQAQQEKERYQKLHAEGKTEQARADLERLALVREKRDAEAARKKAEAEEKAEHDKAKAEQLAREEKLRAEARGTPKKKGGKKK